MRVTTATICAALALTLAPGTAGAMSATERSVRFAIEDLKSGLRHNDGARACGRMTLRLRSQIIAAAVKADPSFAGEGCARVLDIYGRDAYDEINRDRGRMVGFRSHGSCADWKLTTGGRRHAVEHAGRWLAAGDGGC